MLFEISDEISRQDPTMIVVDMWSKIISFHPTFSPSLFQCHGSISSYLRIPKVLYSLFENDQKKSKNLPLQLLLNLIDQNMKKCCLDETSYSFVEWNKKKTFHHSMSCILLLFLSWWRKESKNSQKMLRIFQIVQQLMSFVIPKKNSQLSNLNSKISSFNIPIPIISPPSSKHIYLLLLFLLSDFLTNNCSPQNNMLDGITFHVNFSKFYLLIMVYMITSDLQSLSLLTDLQTLRLVSYQVDQIFDHIKSCIQWRMKISTTTQQDLVDSKEKLDDLINLAVKFISLIKNQLGNDHLQMNPTLSRNVEVGRKEVNGKNGSTNWNGSSNSDSDSDFESSSYSSGEEQDEEEVVGNKRLRQKTTTTTYSSRVLSFVLKCTNIIQELKENLSNEVEENVEEDPLEEILSILLEETEEIDDSNKIQPTSSTVLPNRRSFGSKNEFLVIGNLS